MTPVIFVTVGTHQQPFERLIKGLSGLPADELVVQHGSVAPPAGVRHVAAFMPFPEVLEHLRRADVVITHAGVGSILCATNAGHVPIVVPRLKRHGEHVDDHQVELIDELGRLGHVTVVREVAELASAVAQAPPRRAPSERRPGPLQTAVHAALRGQRRVAAPAAP